MNDTFNSLSDIVETTTFQLFKKELSKLLPKLELSKTDNADISVVIGILDSYLKSSDIDWINEGEKILNLYPQLKKYFPDTVGSN